MVLRMFDRDFSEGLTVGLERLARVLDSYVLSARGLRKADIEGLGGHRHRGDLGG